MPNAIAACQYASTAPVTWHFVPMGPDATGLVIGLLGVLLLALLVPGKK